jgi:hypothetical protein
MSTTKTPNAADGLGRFDFDDFHPPPKGRVEARMMEFSVVDIYLRASKDRCESSSSLSSLQYVIGFQVTADAIVPSQLRLTLVSKYQFIRNMRAILPFTVLTASQLASAHFGLTYPEWRADTLTLEDEYSQWTWPCKLRTSPQQSPAI